MYNIHLYSYSNLSNTSTGWNKLLGYYIGLFGYLLQKSYFLINTQYFKNPQNNERTMYLNSIGHRVCLNLLCRLYVSKLVSLKKCPVPISQMAYLMRFR